MICSKRRFCASEKRLHLADVGGLAVDELLGQIFNLAVMVCPLVHIFDAFDHTAGIAQNHHVRDFGVGIAVAQFHSCHHVRHEPLARLKFRQFPATLGCQGVCLTFDGIVFLQLGSQCLPQAGTHGGIQNASYAHLTHLCGF